MLDKYESKPRQSQKLCENLIYRQSCQCYLRQVVPEGKIVNLVPKYVPHERKTKSNIARSKEPKFVPYEPYKASVDPIYRKKVVEKGGGTKNNVDIQDLVSQLSNITAVEINRSKTESADPSQLISREHWEKEKLNFETDIKNLRETNTHLENQLKFQAQVNGELKTLLVAAVGEDLESRVQHLTEDKLALARELLKSANHLTSHEEHTEWLSGQCEVWRSKFLASSLMVEELAHWKSTLSNKIEELKDVLKRLLDERFHIRDNAMKTYTSLTTITDHIHHPIENKTDLNILDLSQSNRQLSEFLERHYLKDAPGVHRRLEKDVSDTVSEQLAFCVLKNPVVIQDKPDILCNAVMGAANMMGRGQLFLQNPSKYATCCSHCQGDIKYV